MKKEKTTKNILMIMDIPEDTGSYIGRYYTLANELSSLGYSVTMLMPRHDNRDIIVNSNFKIKCMGKPLFKKLKNTREYYSSTYTFGLMLTYIFQILNFYFTNKIDILYLCKPLPASGVASIIIKLFVSKFIIDVDDLENITNNTKSKFQYLVLSFFENHLPRYADIVTTHTTFLYNNLLEHQVNKNKIYSLPNGIDTTRFNTNFIPSNKKECFSILYFGDLNIDSGHSVDILIKSLSFLKKKYTTFKLIIVGDGKDMFHLQQLSENLEVNNFIEWKGRIAPTDIHQFLLSSDVSIDPVSDHLGNLSRFPFKIIESAYCKVPVITSDYGDRKNILLDAGIYANPDDPSDLADKIYALIIENDHIKKKRKEKLYDYAEKYIWTNIIKHFQRDVLEKIE